MKFEKLLYLGLGFSIGVIVNYVFISNKSRRDSNINPNAFLLSVQITFKDEETKESFKSIFKPFADYVMKNEKDTLSYELFESDKDSKIVYIFERYKTKNDYLEIHRKSTRFLEFKESLLKLSDRYEMNGHSYIQTDYGYI